MEGNILKKINPIKLFVIELILKERIPYWLKIKHRGPFGIDKVLYPEQKGQKKI
jgi:hypothetical protein